MMPLRKPFQHHNDFDQNWLRRVRKDMFSSFININVERGLTCTFNFNRHMYIHLLTDSIDKCVINK